MSPHHCFVSSVSGLAKTMGWYRELVARWLHLCAGHHKRQGLQRNEAIREYKCPARKDGHHAVLCASWKPSSTTASPINWRTLGTSPSASHPMSNTNGGTSEGNTAARPTERLTERIEILLLGLPGYLATLPGGNFPASLA